MAKGSNAVVVSALVVVAVALLLQSSEATMTHVVGGALNWTVPQGGAATYTTWASTQNFTVGDILVFNFLTTVHDVAEVTKAAFDACNSTSTLSLSNTGPTNITLTSAGGHYYICTVGNHCSLGQQLAINVSAASTKTSPAPRPAAPTKTSPAPQPAAAPTPSTSPAPAPSPSSVPTPTPTPSPPASTPASSTSATSPPAASTPSGSTAAPPPPNSSARLIAASAALPITLLSLAAVLLH